VDDCCDYGNYHLGRLKCEDFFSVLGLPVSQALLKNVVLEQCIWCGCCMFIQYLKVHICVAVLLNSQKEKMCSLLFK
jgi:hypothetical protein